MAKEPRGLILQARITEQGMVAIDQRRHGWSRSEYVRQALKLAVSRGLVGPEEG